jgi:hypothetical protein
MNEGGCPYAIWVGGVTAMLIFYAFEDCRPWFVLAFAAACATGSLYGFLQGAWPFGLVEAVWMMIALKRLVPSDEEQDGMTSHGAFALSEPSSCCRASLSEIGTLLPSQLACLSVAIGGQRRDGWNKPK